MDRPALTPSAARLLTACDRVFPTPPAGEVVEMQWGQSIEVFGDVPFDSRASRREAA